MDKVLGSVILDHDKELEKLEKELSKAEQGLGRANGRRSDGFVWKMFMKKTKKEGLIE